jgi:predicted nucleotidyltransferase
MRNKISIALRLTIELNIPDVNFAFVGGSVGRGNDDEWSDIDLTICVDDEDIIVIETLSLREKRYSYLSPILIIGKQLNRNH